MTLAPVMATMPKEAAALLVVNGRGSISAAQMVTNSGFQIAPGVSGIQTTTLSQSK
jgi:hypothetical protein